MLHCIINFIVHVSLHISLLCFITFLQSSYFLQSIVNLIFLFMVTDLHLPYLVAPIFHCHSSTLLSLSLSGNPIVVSGNSVVTVKVEESWKVSNYHSLLNVFFFCCFSSYISSIKRNVLVNFMWWYINCSKQINEQMMFVIVPFLVVY